MQLFATTKTRQTKSVTSDSISGVVRLLRVFRTLTRSRDMRAFWHLKYFLFRPTSITGCDSSCFCSITRWIVSIALGNQATVHMLLSCNFLGMGMVMMLNGKWLYDCPPKLRTVSTALNGWCMSGGEEAEELYLAAAFSSKSSRTGFDISLRLETKMTRSVSFCERRGVGAQRKVLQRRLVLFILTNRNRKSHL